MESSNKKQSRGYAFVDKKYCVACGECMKHCKLGAINILHGCYAMVDEDKCVGCKRCIIACPASTIELKEVK